MLGREMASAALWTGWLWLGDAAQVRFSMGGMPRIWGFQNFPPYKLLQREWVFSTALSQPLRCDLGESISRTLTYGTWVSGPGLFCTFLLDPFQVWGSLASSTLSKTARIMWPASTNHSHSFHSLSPYPLEIAISEAWVCSQCFFFSLSLCSTKQKFISSRSLKFWGSKRFLYSIV